MTELNFRPGFKGSLKRNLMIRNFNRCRTPSQGTDVNAIKISKHKKNAFKNYLAGVFLFGFLGFSDRDQLFHIDGCFRGGGFLFGVSNSAFYLSLGRMNEPML